MLAMTNRFLILAFITLCHSMLFAQSQSYTRISVGPGPEDMVLDTIGPSPRLLISCNARRETQTPGGNIYELSLRNDQVAVLPRYGEPAGIEFHPHGIDIVKRGTEYWLYVINHEDRIARESILAYVIKPDRLEFSMVLRSDEMISMNDLVVKPDGSLFFTNDSGKRHNLIEKILQQKKGSLVYYNGAGGFFRVVDGLGMANSLVILGKYLYLSTTFEDKLFRFDITPTGISNQKVMAEIKGQDNITIYRNYLLIASHPKPMLFMKHANSADNLSPTSIHSYNLVTGETKEIYQNDGTVISAGSTAIYWDGYLYIGQVFESFIIKTKLDRL